MAVQRVLNTWLKFMCCRCAWAHSAFIVHLLLIGKHKLSICSDHYYFPPLHYVLLYPFNSEKCCLISILFSFQAQRSIQRRMQAGKFRTTLLLLLLFVRASFCCLGSALFLVYKANLVSGERTNTDPPAFVSPCRACAASGGLP